MWINDGMVTVRAPLILRSPKSMLTWSDIIIRHGIKRTIQIVIRINMWYWQCNDGYIYIITWSLGHLLFFKNHLLLIFWDFLNAYPAKIFFTMWVYKEINVYRIVWLQLSCEIYINLYALVYWFIAFRCFINNLVNSVEMSFLCICVKGNFFFIWIHSSYII